MIAPPTRHLFPVSISHCFMAQRKDSQNVDMMCASAQFLVKTKGVVNEAFMSPEKQQQKQLSIPFEKVNETSRTI